MIARLVGFLFGDRRLTARGGNKIPFLNTVESLRIPVYATHFSGDEFFCRLSNREAKRLYSVCQNNGIEVELSPLLGFGGAVFRYRRRVGLFIGALFMAAVTFFSRDFIWDMQIVGNDTVAPDKILSILEELGCTPGAYIPSLDFEMIANDFLCESDDIAWMSVNMRSSLAVVEVLERKTAVDIPFDRRKESGCANLVASEDGEIVLAAIDSGKRIVSPGDVVRKGELLATGEIEVSEDEVRYEYASGHVKAKVYREITASAMLSGEKKQYTGREKRRKIVKIFGKSKNLFLNGGIEYAKYDKIIKEDKITIFGVIPLPATLRIETEREYELVPCTFSENEARETAIRDYKAQLDDLLTDGELCSVEKIESFDGEFYTVKGRIYLIKDIAQVSEPCKQ